MLSTSAEDVGVLRVNHCGRFHKRNKLRVYNWIDTTQEQMQGGAGQQRGYGMHLNSSRGKAMLLNYAHIGGKS